MSPHGVLQVLGFKVRASYASGNKLYCELASGFQKLDLEPFKVSGFRV